jgi:hypothetical protein
LTLITEQTSTRGKEEFYRLPINTTKRMKKTERRKTDYFQYEDIHNACGNGDGKERKKEIERHKRE